MHSNYFIEIINVCATPMAVPPAHNATFPSPAPCHPVRLAHALSYYRQLAARRRANGAIVHPLLAHEGLEKADPRVRLGSACG